MEKVYPLFNIQYKINLPGFALESCMKTFLSFYTAILDEEA